MSNTHIVKGKVIISQKGAEKLASQASLARAGISQLIRIVTNNMEGDFTVRVQAEPPLIEVVAVKCIPQWLRDKCEEFFFETPITWNAPSRYLLSFHPSSQPKTGEQSTWQ